MVDTDVDSVSEAPESDDDIQQPDEVDPLPDPDEGSDEDVSGQPDEVAVDCSEPPETPAGRLFPVPGSSSTLRSVSPDSAWESRLSLWVPAAR